MVSLIVTVLNEVDNLPRWFESILSQSVLPDEVVIVDGGSRDGTWEWLGMQKESVGCLRIFQHVGNIASGRNFAISRAGGDVIVVADAGCFYRKDWLEKMIAPILSNAAVFSTSAFGPWFEARDGMLVRLIASATIPTEKEFNHNWLPSSRSVAFLKKIWQDVGGYPEWIPICEDVVFDFKIKRMGITFYYIKEKLVFWRPRTSLRNYFVQLFRYTRSDGHGKLWFDRQLIRYFSYTCSVFLLYLSARYSSLFTFFLLVGFFVYMKKFWLRWIDFARGVSTVEKIFGLLLMVGMVVIGDVAKMLGWPVGVYERWKKIIKFAES